MRIVERAKVGDGGGGGSTAARAGSKGPKTVTMVLPVDANATFATVWEKAERRYRENYEDGRRG